MYCTVEQMSPWPANGSVEGAEAEADAVCSPCVAAFRPLTVWLVQKAGRAGGPAHASSFRSLGASLGSSRLLAASLCLQRATRVLASRRAHPVDAPIHCHDGCPATVQTRPGRRSCIPQATRQDLPASLRELAAKQSSRRNIRPRSLQPLVTYLSVPGHFISAPTPPPSPLPPPPSPFLPPPALACVASPRFSSHPSIRTDHLSPAASTTTCE